MLSLHKVNKSYRLFTLIVLGSLAVAGCTSQTTPSAEGQAVLLEAEPADAVDLTDYKNSLVTGLGMGEATIVGRVRSGEKEPWDDKEATFLLTSLQLESESHDHGGDDHSDCKFCQAKENESLTLVRVLNEDGGVFKTDARKLLGLKTKDLVVVQGQGMLSDEGSLLFDATRVFIKK